MSPLRVTEREAGVRFAVRLQPRSSRSGIDGIHGDALKVRVQAPPVDGEANGALVTVTGKGNRTRTIPLGAQAAQALRRWLQARGLCARAAHHAATRWRDGQV